MPKATQTPITAAAPPTQAQPSTSRRGLLAGTGMATALAAVGLSSPPAPARAAPPFTTAMSPEHRDAEMLAACSAFMAAEQALDAIPSDAPDEIHGAALDRYHDAYTRAEAIRPITLAGLKAKAQVVRSGLAMQEVDETNEEAAEWQILGAWHLVQDLLALGGAA